MRRTDHRAAHPRSADHVHDTALFIALNLVVRPDCSVLARLAATESASTGYYLQLIQLLFLPC
jgi:hypothetical protein